MPSDRLPSIFPSIISTSNRARWTRHVPALDGVRGLAILLVMAHNFNLLEAPETFSGKATNLLLDWGWVGVQLFFVLSGFLITNILLSTKSAGNYFRSFFGRRSVRIFPLYFVALAVGLLLFPLLTGESLEGSEHQVWLWTYLSNWAAPMGREVASYPHMWSLAVEEQFYLVWPFVVYFMSRRGLLRLCVGLTAVALLTRIGIRVMDGNPEAAYQFTICRIDAIALGAIAAISFRDDRITGFLERHRSSVRILLVAATVLTVVLTRGAPRVGILTQTYGYTLFAIIAAVLVLDTALSTGRGDWLTRFLCWPLLQKAGTYSYGAYVLHKPVHEFFGLPMLQRLTGQQSAGPLLAILYFVGLSIVVFFLAYFSFHAIEKHFLALKRHFAASS